MRKYLFIILLIFVLIFSSCATPRITLFSDDTVPLQEFTLQGKGKDKILVIPIKGEISGSTSKGLIFTKPSMIQEVVSQLKQAEKDKAIKAIILKIDSPGGTVTASDILYHEILAFKNRTGIKLVAAMMDVAASGGYYIALPADFIMAHPTTITGSIGVIFMQPKVNSLMEKIGVGLDINKSGKNKDMGSPFRNTTDEERKLFQDLTDELGKRFINLVSINRKLEKNQLAEISTARIYLAPKALELGLIDKIGYLDDAISETKKLAGLSQDARIVIYRRTQYPNDNLYNTSVDR
ncbi:MAG: signal peptide peptidase SppA, partial [Desulfobacterales bacterium]|nr:signal peptide peptidase SppA [Desulfobacterales bacterium]MDX2508743.1 signal peptide peptidase SppA [Desulfobacterales bacterium]